MHRFYLPPTDIQASLRTSDLGRLELTAREAHHAVHVRRLRQGEQVMVLDGAGHAFLCEMEGAARKEVLLRVVEERSVPAPAYQISLLQALPKGKLIESIVQKATELGASRIVPLVTERVVTQLEGRAAEQKEQKLQGVAIEAMKQCGAAWLPKVEAPVTPAEFLARGEPFELPLVASLQSDSQHARNYFRAFETQHGRRPRSLCIWIGPEGDFSGAELDAIKASGARPITLGQLVLRTETAACYCLSIFNYELQAPPAL
ncbi:Ribosomal RNA small subunit methyltransferase E [Verrucomicrobia bacterium]|nr:Ribosomal RNA small subunit methyltransferase E [Verrucomicrobiota bacterium]